MPQLTVADLMCRVYYMHGEKSAAELEQCVRWLDRQFPSARRWEVDRDGDPADRSLTHLVGLNFSRSWCLSHIAAVARKAGQAAQAGGGGGGLAMGRAEELEAMAAEHLAAALPLATSGGWMGDHWLHTFALLALQAAATAAASAQPAVGGGEPPIPGRGNSPRL